MIVAFVGAMGACGGLVGADFDDWKIDAPPPEAGGPPEEEDSAPLIDGALPQDSDGPEEPPDASTDALPDGGCADGLTLCQGTCFDTQVHDSHCGGCGIPCTAAEDCVAGKCKMKGTLTTCRSTPTTCNEVCEAVDRVCSSSCGGGGNAIAVAYGEFDFTCSGQSVVVTGAAQCGVEIPEANHGSLRCCCAPP